jgi:hypothetical protein
MPPLSLAERTQLQTKTGGTQQLAATTAALAHPAPSTHKCRSAHDRRCGQGTEARGVALCGALPITLQLFIPEWMERSLGEVHELDLGNQGVVAAGQLNAILDLGAAPASVSSHYITGVGIVVGVNSAALARRGVSDSWAGHSTASRKNKTETQLRRWRALPSRIAGKSASPLP